MHFKKIKLCILNALLLIAAFVSPKDSEAQSRKYNVDSNLLKLPVSFTVRSISSVALDKEDNIYIFHRGNRKFNKKYPESTELIKEPTILKFSNQGKLIDSFGANMFSMPHMITVDKNNNLWAVDVWLQQVIKLSKKGKVLLTLGEVFKPGSDSLHFDLPTDVAIASGKSVFVGDGYANARICNFNASGRWNYSFGKRGTERGEFDTPHSIAVYKEKLFVADRENSRLQVFDPQGNFLNLWDGKHLIGRVQALAIDNAGKMYVTGTGGTVLLSDKLEVLETWSEKGHDVAVDSKGSIYLCTVGGFIKVSKAAY